MFKKIFKRPKPSDLPETLPTEPESELSQEASKETAPVEQPDGQVQPPLSEAPVAGSGTEITQETDDTSLRAGQPEQVEPPEQERAPDKLEASLEERFADIRHSLIEEEKREEKKPHVVRWLKNKLKDAEERSQSRQLAKEEAAEAGKETEVPQSLRERVSAEEPPETPAPVEVKPVAGPLEQQQEPVPEAEIPPELAALLQKIEEEAKPEQAAEGPAVEPARVEERPSFADVKQKLATRKEEPEDIHKIRDLALQDYVEPAPTPKVRQFTSPTEYFKNLVMGLTKLEKRLILGSIVGIVLIIVFAYGFSWLKPQPNLSATATVKASLPYPVMVTLPGGWTFSLNRGYVQNGIWNPPAGAEWLDGTEICRVISLPWSLQLESVIRTLKAEDQIVLVMSDSKTISYRVLSIRSVAADEWNSQCQDGLSLLLILADKKSDKRWVVNAIP
jgi:hypothetical protein